MPELPEVEAVRRGLEAHLVGRRITGVDVPVPKVLREPTQSAQLFAENLIGRSVKSVNRRGKYLILSLDNGYSLAAHLRMRGQLRIALPGDFDTDRYLCARMALDDGREWRYYDAWAWGELRVIPGGLDEVRRSIPAVSEMGPEPLTEAFSPQTLMSAGERSPKRAIKAVLLDQAVLAGVGNIYADESLYRAGIHPLMRCASLDESVCVRLHAAIRSVIAEAVECGGTESDNFVDVGGRPGRYKPLVYGRQGRRCARCGSCVQRIKVGGRGTAFCAQCQPLSATR